MTRRQLWRELAWSAAIAVVALIVAVVGEPQPFAIIVAALGWLTAAYIAVTALDAATRPAPPSVPVPPDEAQLRDTLRATYPLEEDTDGRA